MQNIKRWRCFKSFLPLDCLASEALERALLFGVAICGLVE
jgi:hypothetical protein